MIYRLYKEKGAVMLNGDVLQEGYYHLIEGTGNDVSIVSSGERCIVAIPMTDIANIVDVDGKPYSSIMSLRQSFYGFFLGDSNKQGLTVHYEGRMHDRISDIYVGEGISVKRLRGGAVYISSSVVDFEFTDFYKKVIEDVLKVVNNKIVDRCVDCQGVNNDKINTIEKVIQDIEERLNNINHTEKTTSISIEKYVTNLTNTINNYTFFGSVTPSFIKDKYRWLYVPYIILFIIFLSFVVLCVVYVLQNTYTPDWMVDTWKYIKRHLWLNRGRVLRSGYIL